MHIGIFDSGFGGLTVFRSIRARLPQYDYIYLGDNARTPYGNRSFDAIFRFSRECVDMLFERRCKLVIIACNTASAKALRTLQQKVLPLEHPDRRVLGIIRPSAEALASLSDTRTVALWATEGTVKSMSYPMELEKAAPQLTVIQQACPMLVPLVENGELNGSALDYFIEKYWRETLQTAASQSTSAQALPRIPPTGVSQSACGIDALLLACTHYPLIQTSIRRILPPEIKVLTQGEIVAPSLENYLLRHPEIEQALSRTGSQRFLTTDQTEGFDHLAETFLGHAVLSEKVGI